MLNEKNDASEKCDHFSWEILTCLDVKQSCGIWIYLYANRKWLCLYFNDHESIIFEIAIAVKWLYSVIRLY